MANERGQARRAAELRVCEEEVGSRPETRQGREHCPLAVAGQENAFTAKFRRMHLPETHTRCSGCTLPLGVLEEGLHMLLFCAPEDVATDILSEYQQFRAWGGRWCQCKGRAYWRERTAQYKQAGDLGSPHWHWFLHWDMLYGYVRYRGVEALEPECREWLGTRKVLGGPLGEPEYHRRLRKEVFRLLNEEWRLPDGVPSAAEWVRSGTWMRGQAGTGNSTYVSIDGDRVKTRRMKGVEAALKTDEDILADLFTPVREHFFVMEKSEGGKIRPVVKTGNSSYWKMDYLSTLVEEGFRGSKISTLFCGGKRGEELDRDLLELARDRRWIKVPLDQKNFDWHQSRGSIFCVLEAMRDFFRAKGYLQGDVGRVWAMLDESLKLGATVHLGKVKFPWVNGLPSGWRWTALLDTILNLTSFRVAVGVAEDIEGREFIMKGHCAQGDDIIFACQDYGMLRVVVAVYQALGYEVHPQKTYISRVRAEFLRRSYEDRGIVGYAPRTILAIRYRNPVISLPLIKAQRLYSRILLWHLLTLRGALAGKVAAMLLWDAEQMGVARDDAVGFALAPNSVGGAGLESTRGIGMHLIEEWDGVWRVPYIGRERKKVVPEWGKWAGRLKRRGIVLDDVSKEQFAEALALSWGIEETALVGKVWHVWDRIVPVHSSAVDQRSVEVPRPETLWPEDMAPALVQSQWARTLVRTGRWKDLVREEARDWLLHYEKRVSRRVFRAYILGEWKPPAPVLEGISPRFGSELKEWASRQLRKALNTKDMSIALMERKMLWIEERLKRTGAKLRSLGILAA